MVPSTVGARPSLERTLRYAVHGESETAAREQEAPQVESTGLGLRVIVQEEQPEQEGGSSDRDVHVEDPAPGEVRDEESAEHRSNCRARRQSGS